MKAQTRRVHKALPSLESLEHRLVLDNTSFVNNLYHDVLKRLPDPAGSAAWVQQLTFGTSRAGVATSFWQSAEHRALEVTQFYQKYLHRNPDQPGETALENLLKNGATELQIEQIFLNSSEYKILHSSNNTLYVEALYSDVLARMPTSFEETSAENQVAAGNAARVVSNLVESMEDYVDIVKSDYTTYLDRSADSTGQEFWATALQNNGGNVEQVAVGLLASDEYFALGAK